MNSILFTIITVSFNSEKTIEKTINSVLNQTFRNFEYIIIDGKSTDQTLKIIKNYEDKFLSNFHWISESDTGIYNAMNKGIQMANGNIIGIVNSDDWLELNALEIVSRISKESNLSNTIYCGWMNFIYENGKKQLLKTNSNRFNKYSKKYLMGLNHPATFVPMSIYKKYGGFDEELNISADIDFVLRARNNGVNFQFVEEVLSNMQDGGASTHFSVKKIKDRKYLLKKHTNSLIMFYYFVFSYIIINIIKIFVPEKLLIAFRTFNRK